MQPLQVSYMEGILSIGIDDFLFRMRTVYEGSEKLILQDFG
jgi:hypothetical protein